MASSEVATEDHLSLNRSTENRSGYSLAIVWRSEQIQTYQHLPTSRKSLNTGADTDGKFLRTSVSFCVGAPQHRAPVPRAQHSVKSSEVTPQRARHAVQIQVGGEFIVWVSPRILPCSWQKCFKPPKNMKSVIFFSLQIVVPFQKFS